MAKFEREAKLLASLNHPNIAGIYGLEQADGNRFQMKISSGNFEYLKLLREKHERLLREFWRFKVENRQFKDQLELADIRNIPDLYAAVGKRITWYIG